MARWVVGIDEVGRGALAGPVVVVAAMLAVDAKGRAYNPFETLKDSKQLSAAPREWWSKKLRVDPRIRFAIARVAPRGIEKLNISAAANRAAEKAFARMAKAHALSASTPIMLDGGLFLGNKHKQKKQYKTAKTMPKADETIPAVAAASIIAKVARDRYMVNLSKKHPHYGFDIHKGYGTLAHRRAIKKYGPCEAHRLTFLAKRIIINR